MLNKLLPAVLGLALVAGCDQKDMYHGEDEAGIGRPPVQGIEGDEIEGNENVRPRTFGIEGAETTSSLYPGVRCPLPMEEREGVVEGIEGDAIESNENVRARSFAIRGADLTCGLFDDVTCPQPKKEREEVINGIEGDWLDGAENFFPRRFDITGPEMTCPGN